MQEKWNFLLKNNTEKLMDFLTTKIIIFASAFSNMKIKWNGIGKDNTRLLRNKKFFYTKISGLWGDFAHRLCQIWSFMTTTFFITTI